MPGLKKRRFPKVIPEIRAFIIKGVNRYERVEMKAC